MAYRRTPFVLGEWYHCFTRGVDKRTVFETPQDYNRFSELLYLANSTETIDRGRIQHLSHERIFSVPRGNPLVGIGTYCLMNNHPHLLLREKTEGGITKFMHKILTGFTMYFNIRRERVGNLFVTPFRSKHINDDQYLRWLFQYIHLNPAEIFEPGWKEGIVKNMTTLEKKLIDYPYSSALDYFKPHSERAEKAILDPSTCEFVKTLPSFRNTIRDMKVYSRGEES